MSVELLNLILLIQLTDGLACHLLMEMKFHKSESEQLIFCLIWLRD